jgi:hypothetical protein
MRIEQSDSYQGNDWWEWAVWVDDAPTKLDSIDHVVYRLHPSFRPPVQKVAERRTNFGLKTSGWGTFTIFADVHYKDGKIEILEHELKLYYPEAEKKAPVLIRLSSTDGDVSLPLQALRNAVLDAAPESDAEIAKMPPISGPSGSLPAGEALSVDLTGPSVAALTRALQSWMSRNQEAKLKIIADGGKTVADITPENVVKVLGAMMMDLRK